MTTLWQRLWQRPFAFGIRFTDYHKARSMQLASRRLTVNKGDILTIPLQQHKGSKPKVVVCVGDYVYKGQLLARHHDTNSVPVHASTSGYINAIEPRPIPHQAGLQDDCIILSADGLDDWGHARLPSLANYPDYDADTLRQRIWDAGIVGLGGAVFPAAIKLKVLPHMPISTLIINGVECEPYISCDDCLMREQADSIIAGIQIMLHILQPEICMIGVEDNKPEAIQHLQQCLAQQQETRIQVVPIPTRYPAGGEKQLITFLTQKEVPSGQRPAEIGVICHNVATARAIYQAVVFGEPLIERYITVTGEAIQQPQNLSVPLGISMQTLIEAAGGYSHTPYELKMGGPMMGITLPHANIPVVKASNCLLVRPAVQEPMLTMPCIRCGKCADSCPVGLLPQQLYWHAQAKNVDQIEQYHLFDCIECACCNHVCPSQIPLVDYYRFAKAEIRAQQKAQQKADQARERHEFRLMRLERDKQEKAEKLAQHKKALAEKQQATSTSHEKGEVDPKKAAIQAALERAKAKKAQYAKQQDNAP